MEWIYALAALASSLAAVLAWTAKLVWSKEYKEAKEETIKAKEAQIELLKNEIDNLRDLTPMKLREYFVSVKQQLEEYNENLQKELSTKSQQIVELKKSGEAKEAEVEQLIDDRKALETKIRELEEVVNDEFISKLIEHSWADFQLKVKGDKDEIEAFVERAMGLGNSTGNSVRYVGDNYIVDLRYANTVSRESLDKLLRNTNLHVIEISSGRGISF